MELFGQTFNHHKLYILNLTQIYPQQNRVPSTYETVAAAGAVTGAVATAAATTTTAT